MPVDQKRVKNVFLEASEQPEGAARVAYLDRTCQGDAELRSSVEALLAFHDPDGSFLGTPAVEIPDPDNASTRAFDPDYVSARTGAGTSDGGKDDEVPLGFLAPSTRPDSLGRIGHYDVLQVLGQGGFGIVFRAFDDVLHRVVAVKVLSPQMAATSPARKRFLREARSSAQVRHENVVQVYEVGEQPLPYIVMEFIPGETLQQRLNRTGPVDVPEVVRVGRQIAEGLAAAHATDLIHRDIKPGNVLLEGGAQRVKITDFGLARAADDASISQSGLIAGTPMYMAPEQAKGEKLDQRADLFSLGSVLYQMAAGRAPFRANGTLAVLKRVAEDTPRDIREITPETPQWLCDIISKLHAKNPDDRYQSARGVADVLADCEAQLKANAKLKDFSRIPKSEQPAGGKSGRWKRVAAVALLLPVLALAATEIAGVTHLFRGPLATDAIKPGSEPMPVVVPKPEPLPTTFTNGIGIEFVLVPKGRAWLGGGKDKPGEKEVEIPADFFLGRYEVTQEEWEKVMGSNPSEFRRGNATVAAVPDADLKRLPVDSVTWDECQSFVTKLNNLEKESGWVYRLPTEAEWEYAYRGGPMSDRQESAFDFYLAVPANAVDRGHANFGGGSGDRTCKVGSYPANRLGLFDMVGNVCEWCDDPVNAGTGATMRVVRGMGWNVETGFYLNRPRGVSSPSFRHFAHGLRLARVPSGAAAPEAKTLPTAVAPFTDADVRRIAALPAAEQVKEVGKELVRRNPGFDGRITPTIRNDAVIGLKFTTENVKDISPVRALTQLQVLDMWSYPKGALSDLAPLQGMPLVSLRVEHTAVSDLSPLKGMKLEELCIQMTPTTDLTPLTGMPLKRFDLCGVSQVTDLKPLQGMPLEYLNLASVPFTDLSIIRSLTSLRQVVLVNTLVSDLAPLQGMKLSMLAVDGSKVSDLSPLKGMELTRLRLTPRSITQGWTIIREMKSLENIYITDDKVWSAGEFWRRYDRGAFNGTEKFPADRTAAEYVLTVGGAVKVDGEDKEIKTVAELPGDAFRLTAVLLASNQRVTDAGLAVFDGCTNLTYLDLRFTPVGDAGVAHFRGCTDLRYLDLNTTSVTDAGLTHLKDCAELRNFSLAHTAVTDKGVAGLQNLKKVTALDLNGCEKVSGSGLVAFKDCSELWFLGLEGTGATDKELAQFTACKKLQVLNLRGTKVTDDGLARFEDCKSISMVSLAGTKVSDEGLAHLKKRKNLTKLELEDTKITDAGLAELVGLEKLTELTLAKSQVTAKGVEMLATSLPMCKIKWDGGVIEPK